MSRAARRLLSCVRRASALGAPLRVQRCSEVTRSPALPATGRRNKFAETENWPERECSDRSCSPHRCRKTRRAHHCYTANCLPTARPAAERRTRSRNPHRFRTGHRARPRYKHCPLAAGSARSCSRCLAHTDRPRCPRSRACPAAFASSTGFEGNARRPDTFRR